MPDTPSQDDASSPSFQPDADPDAHGQAALLLAESILHELIDAGSLTNAQAVNAVRTAAEVKVLVAEKTGEATAVMVRSLGLLRRVEQSLHSDDGAPPPTPPVLTVV